MLSNQIQFYDSLSEEEKYIVHLCAIQAKDVNAYTLIRLIPQKYKVTNQFIKGVLKACKDRGILYNIPYSQDCITPEFLVWLFPLLPEMKTEWETIYDKKDVAFFYSSSFIPALRDYLYALFLDQEQLEKKDISLRYGKRLRDGVLQSIY